MVGVLALQGDFERHAKRLEELNATPLLVTTADDLEKVDGLVIPGGESSVLLKLSSQELREKLTGRIKGGLPVLATCAGLIFLANKVENPAQDSLHVLDITAIRNAYGRQVDSFVEPNLHWTSAGAEALNWHKLGGGGKASAPVEGVFIRAPRIANVGKNAQVLIERDGEPVMVGQGKIFGATFHPELSENTLVHELFLATLP